MQDKYLIGDKEYSKEELLEFGKQHYPKFYWIYRGVGIGLMFTGVVTALIYLAIALALNTPSGSAFDFNVYYYVIMIVFALIAIAGAILFAISFKKRPDADYIKHAIDYYTKLDANQKAREAKIQRRDERVARKEEEKDISQLLKYKELLDAGIITQDEFDAKKKELLG